MASKKPGRPRLARAVKVIGITLPLATVRRIDAHASVELFGASRNDSIRDLIERGLGRAEKRRGNDVGTTGL